MGTFQAVYGDALTTGYAFSYLVECGGDVKVLIFGRASTSASVNGVDLEPSIMRSEVFFKIGLCKAI